MAVRKFILANLYIITIAWFIGGFGWMFTLLFFPDLFYLVLPAFIVTVSGNFWLWATYHYAGRESKPKVPTKQKERKAIASEEHHEQPHFVPMPPM
jgi:hypothetical protein